jgi:signal transduction histidine kinase
VPGHAEQLREIVGTVLANQAGRRGELDVMVGGAVQTYDFRFEPTKRGVIAVGFDITPSKRAEASLRETDRRKDEFLATLSHELRNPLTPLKVALDVAKLAKTDDKRERSFEIMDRQVVQLEQLVDELLDLSRITQGKVELHREEVDIGMVVEAALEATRPVLAKLGHTLDISVPADPQRVTGDLTRLTQVLTNLLRNAAKYTPDGGKIDLTVVAVPEREVVQIRVRDSGRGIPKAMLDRIFDIFVQVHPTPGTQGGLGIGLNLVRRLVELHGGTVTANSDGDGRGSEFVVELPRRRG